MLWPGTVALIAAIAISMTPLRAAPSDTLIVCTEASPDFLNAQLSTTSFDVSEQVSDRLLEMRTGGSDLIPGLAESWTISPDGMSYTFKLRHGVKWQSNASFKPTRDMGADDVVFSFQRMFDRSNPFYTSANGNFPEFIDLLEPTLASIDKAADDTVVLRLKSPSAPLLASLSMQAFSILSAEYAASLQKSGKPEDLDRALIGTGPFSFVHTRRTRWSASVRSRISGESGRPAGPRGQGRQSGVRHHHQPVGAVRQAAHQRMPDCPLPEPVGFRRHARQPRSPVAGCRHCRDQLSVLQHRHQAIRRHQGAPGAGDGDRHARSGPGGVPGQRHRGSRLVAVCVVGT